MFKTKLILTLRKVTNYHWNINGMLIKNNLSKIIFNKDYG